MINSAGSMLTNTLGTALPESFLPGTAAVTSFQFSLAGSLEKLAGNLSFTGDHGPPTDAAWSHDASTRR